MEAFPHDAGVHCESTTLRDQVNFAGVLDFPVSEALAFGLDATIGFVSWLPAEFPEWRGGFVLGGKGGTFSEKSLACRLLGLQVDRRSFSDDVAAWDDARACVARGVPVMLQLDMAYLPFFQELEDAVDERGEPVHFGGHLLTLVGHDPAGEEALVADNNFAAFQRVPRDALTAARASREGPEFLWPRNTRYTLARRPDGKHPPLGAGAKLAIQQAVDHMRAASMNTQGLAGLQRLVNAIPTWPEYLGADPARGARFLASIHDYVEAYGTGGALFRAIYAEFLEELLDLPAVREGPRAWTPADRAVVSRDLPVLREAASFWTEFAHVARAPVTDWEAEAVAHADFARLHHLGKELLARERLFWENLTEVRL